MDAFYSTSSAAAAADWCYASLNKFREISPAVRSHLKLVYRTVCFALVSSAVGAYVHVALNIGGTLTMLACMGNIVLFSLTPVYEEVSFLRFGLLMAAALLQGATVCPLIHPPMDFDPSVLATGFVGIAIALGCFSCITLIAKRSVTSIAKRSEYMYLRALLSSDLSILLWLQLATSIFVLLSGSLMVEVYSGILIFVGYMVYDMQQIIKRAHRGDMDYIGHALTLFTDITAILDRIFIIMNACDKSKDKKRKMSTL
ncbi:bax inhibitor 1-like [Triticum dicoccoides]|uniref:bax inhibitor 1-like n=1 Tax=Triticum dicoccoides TaxID=85692 RepID=UPI00188E6AD5|nr:bax inhibitor 1-like [Triticum dicoccoides]